MNFILAMLLGGVAGYLTGKAVDAEGSAIVRTGYLVDSILGAVGALFGEYLFFWIVIGKGSSFTDFAAAILGAITFVGAARLLSGRLSNRNT
jgi:uncharacterized membrane protein YeaQ/YmgE (transglycosylase-associated protein family)